MAPRVCLSFPPAVGLYARLSGALSPSLFFTALVLPGRTHLPLPVDLRGAPSRARALPLTPVAGAAPLGFLHSPPSLPLAGSKGGTCLGFGVRHLGSRPDPPQALYPDEPSVQWAHATGSAGYPGEGWGRNGTRTNIRMPLCLLLSLAPPFWLPPCPWLSAHCHTCLPPSQTPSLPVAQMCGKRRRAFHWGNLLNSHNPASARIFSVSLNLPRFVIPLLSPSICACGLGRHPVPCCRRQPCQPTRVGLPGRRGVGGRANPPSVGASVSSPIRSRG